MKNLIKQFNKPDTFMVISDYPEKTKTSEKNYGIAWYTKELIEPLSKQFGSRFIVLAEKATDDRRKTYQKNKILVLRVFDQKRPSLFPRILKWMFTFNKVKNIHVHSEFCTNGGIKNFILVIPFFLLIKLTGKNITYFSHNVVLELDSIAPHLGFKKGSFKLKILNTGLHYYYRVLGLMVDKFVVMDEVMYKRLSLFVNEEKIMLFPFWVDATKTLPIKQAREKLDIKEDEFVLLYFGFITYYKGADWLIKSIKALRKEKGFKKIRLILAGGQAYSLKDKPYYQKFYNDLLESIKNEPYIQITGFVPETEITTYFSAADAVVFSYRGLIGGSGSLTLALAHRKPFILAEGMGELVMNKDVQAACFKNNIKPTELLFSQTTASLGKKILQLQDTTYRAGLAHLSADIATSRSKTNLLNNCYNQLYANPRTDAKSNEWSFASA